MSKYPFNGSREAAPQIDERRIQIAGVVAVRRHRLFYQADTLGQRAPDSEVAGDCEQFERFITAISLPLDGLYSLDRFGCGFLDGLGLHCESLRPGMSHIIVISRGPIRSAFLPEWTVVSPPASGTCRDSALPYRPIGMSIRAAQICRATHLERWASVWRRSIFQS